MKICSKCKVQKDIREFYAAASQCKPCKLASNAAWLANHLDSGRRIRREAAARWREKHPTRKRDQSLRSSYGISLNQYDAMFSAQGGKCAICGTHQAAFRRALSVDHSHVTGGVRQLLCGPCNTILGLAKDDAGRLLNASIYLTRHAEVSNVR